MYTMPSEETCELKASKLATIVKMKNPDFCIENIIDMGNKLLKTRETFMLVSHWVQPHKFRKVINKGNIITKTSN